MSVDTPMEVAYKLKAVADGSKRHGDALRAAKEFSITTEDEKALLATFEKGGEKLSDRWNMHRFVLKVMIWAGGAEGEEE